MDAMAPNTGASALTEAQEAAIAQLTASAQHGAAMAEKGVGDASDETLEVSWFMGVCHPGGTAEHADEALHKTNDEWSARELGNMFHRT